MNTPIISQLGLKANSLSGETVVISGGVGGGIGDETARALLWLGANVVIAEINGTNGAQARRLSLRSSSRDRWASSAQTLETKPACRACTRNQCSASAKNTWSSITPLSPCSVQ